MKKKIFCLLIFSLLIFLIIFGVENRNYIENSFYKLIKKEDLPEFEYKYYKKMRDAKYMTVLTFRNQNGIKKISYTDENQKETEIDCNGKIEVAIDFLAKNYTSQYFSIQTLSGETLIKELHLEIGNNYVLPEADIYVMENGNNQTGDGSKTAPFSSLKKAVEVAQTGYKIYIAPGIYTLEPMILESGNYSAAGIYDMNKQLEIFGESQETVLIYDGSTSPVRDGPAITLLNSESVVRNLIYEFTPKDSVNYAKAIFAWDNGKTKNVFFRVTGSEQASYLYDNYPDGLSSSENCTFFHDDEFVDNNYSGLKKFLNIATNVTTQGQNTNVITNKFGKKEMSTEELIYQSSQTQDFIDNQVGVFYGNNAWEQY